MDECNIIEYYMEKPYWVIDILPKQVPANGGGQYFKVADYFMTKPQRELLCQKFSNILLKLYCYYDISLLNIHEERVDNPQPDLIVDRLSTEKTVYLLIESEDTMIGYNNDDHYMTLYHPSEEILKMVQMLASSEGLFVWTPTNHD